MLAACFLLTGGRLARLSAPDEVWGNTPDAPEFAPIEPPRPQIYSQAFLNALKNVPRLNARDAAALEQRLRTDPGHWTARLQVMAYYANATRRHQAGSTANRARHVVWLIQHNPESEILGSRYGTFLPGQLPEAELARAEELWARAARSHPSDSRVLWNAARFFRSLDRDASTGFLEGAVNASPNDGRYGRALGRAYARAIIDGSRGGVRYSSADDATSELEATGNPVVLAAAANLFLVEYRRTAAVGGAKTAYRELAVHYFDRAKALDPGLRGKWGLPEANSPSTRTSGEGS